MKQKNYVLIGSIGFVVFIIFFIWVIYQSNHPGIFRNHMTLKAMYTNVGNLQKGSDVTIEGYMVGKVSSIAFNPKNNTITVSMVLNNSPVPFPTDSIAKISTYGLFGNAYIKIVPGGMPDNLKSGDEFQYVQNAIPLNFVLRELSGRLQNGNQKDKKRKKTS